MLGAITLCAVLFAAKPSLAQTKPSVPCCRSPHEDRGAALRDPAYTWTSSVYLLFAHELWREGH